MKNKHLIILLFLTPIFIYPFYVEIEILNKKLKKISPLAQIKLISFLFLEKNFNYKNGIPANKK